MCNMYEIYTVYVLYNDLYVIYYIKLQYYFIIYFISNISNGNVLI